MIPPTFVAEYEVSWSATTSPKTISVTVAAGDTLVVCAMSSDGAETIATPTGGGLTYTLQQSIVVGSYCTNYVWTAPCPGDQTFTLSLSTNISSDLWGYNCLRYSGVSAIGASTKLNASSTAPSLPITTTAANSTIVMVNGDWYPRSGASRVYRQVNSATPVEKSYFYDTSWYTIYVAYYVDAGAAGAKTVGLSAPTAQKASIIAVELIGTTAGTTVGGQFLPFLKR